jgi:hypothetical protein
MSAESVKYTLLSKLNELTPFGGSECSNGSSGTAGVTNQNAICSTGYHDACAAIAPAGHVPAKIRY